MQIIILLKFYSDICLYKMCSIQKIHAWYLSNWIELEWFISSPVWGKKTVLCHSWLYNVLCIWDYNAFSIVDPFFLAFISAFIEFYQKFSQIFYVDSFELSSVCIKCFVFSDFSIYYEYFKWFIGYFLSNLEISVIFCDGVKFFKTS